ncbi:hypothetical protein OOK29_48060 [Streptomyces phaeochromogenes]|uniref:DUF7848 domain-containing protein n=1 Tax=Streptomyces phaeochromogenes TaxID=1923 RepID=UPI0022525C05|nr:hypothetical protein [Streptomyces phaeochromogenes]MCX5605883.1 hypothetical protein [Streptomyces phaeochromogenes]
MTRAVYRFVDHTINHAPEGGYTFEIFCTAHECGEESGPQGEQTAAQDWALKHAGATSHDLFRRVVTDHARVTRADQEEHERPAVTTDGTD